MTRAEREKASKAQRENDLRSVMGTVEGRRVFWRLLEDCRIWGSSFSETAVVAAHSEGRRSVAIDLVNEMQRLAPSEYFAMLTEHRPVLKQMEVDDPPEERNPFE